jgi:hypothetical protein
MSAEFSNVASNQRFRTRLLVIQKLVKLQSTRECLMTINSSTNREGSYHKLAIKIVEARGQRNDK